MKRGKPLHPAAFVGVVLMSLVATLFVSSAQSDSGQPASWSGCINGAVELADPHIEMDVDRPPGVLNAWLPGRRAEVGKDIFEPALAASAASAEGVSTARSETSSSSPAVGTITTVVGSIGEGPAKSVSVLPNGRVAFQNGAIYFADGITSVVRRVDLATGMETAVAGNGGDAEFTAGNFSGEGGPAVDADLGSAYDVAFDAAGNLYLTDFYNARVRKVDANGTITTVAGNGQQGSGGDGGLAPQASVLPWGIVFDQAGNLYISEPVPGDVRKVDTRGIITHFAGWPGRGGDGGPAASASLRNPEGLAVDSSGNVYIAEWGDNRIRKIDRGVITTVAGNGTAAYGGDGGPATQTSLNRPAGLVFDTAGNMYIADQYNFRVRKVDTNGIITTLAGTGNPGYSGDGGPATSATLWYPSGLGFDDAGNLYISDNTSARVRKVDVNGIITSVAGNGRTRYSGDGGPASGAEMGVPHKLAFDSAGNMFVTIFNIYDIAGAAVRKVDTDGCISTDVTAGIGESGCGNGPTIPAALGYPTGIAVDRDGNRFIADASSERVFKVDANGNVTTVAGTGTSGYNGDNMPATQAQLAEPEGLAFDAADNLYIADYNNNRIRKVDTSGTITTVAGNGVAGAQGDGLPAIAAQLWGPRCVAFDAAGNLYIADYYNSLIRKVDAAASIDTTHHISTVAGSNVAGHTSSGFSGDGGLATSATLAFPVGVEADSAGNLYIADTLNHRIRKVDTGGTITTVAGTGAVDGLNHGGFGGDGGPATSANLSQPYHIAFDAAGDLYFTDSHNYRVRKVTLVMPVRLNAVVSRKTHGTVGMFDINLPLAGNPGIECRSGGVNGDYTLVFTFSNPLTNVGSASVTSGSGSVAGSKVDGKDAHNYIVNLTGVTNAQYLTVGLTNVHDSAGDGSNAVSVSMGVLIGDTNGDRFVNSADISQTKSQSGQPVSSANFREDVNADGFLNSADISLVKSKSGTALP